MVFVGAVVVLDGVVVVMMLLRKNKPLIYNF